MYEQAHKPGSVYNGHLSRLIVTDKLKQPTILGDDGPPSFLAPDLVLLRMGFT